MNKPRILCMVDLQPYPDVRKFLDGQADMTYAEADQEKLLELIPGFDAFFGHFHVQVTREVVERGKNLRAVATPTTGTDHVDLEAAAEYGVEVVCIKTEYNLLDTFTATAELAWGLLISAMRQIPAASERARGGHWDRDLFTGRQLSGKTLGILGHGRLGSMVGEYAKAFRMEVIASDVRPVIADNVLQVPFDELLEESDILSLHVHLTDKTRHMVNREAFRKMKDGVVLINTSRGALIDEEAFLEALESGKVAAAGLDVIHGEWDDNLSEHPLIRYAATHPNLIIVPHIGGSTVESNHDARMFTARKLVNFLAGSKPVRRGGR